MKKVLFFMMSLPVLLGAMSACSEVKVDTKKLDGKWTIVEVNGTKIEQEKMPYIEFKMAENKVHGNAGCNTFNSSIKPDSKNISSFTLAPAAATMMACPNMAVEGQIFKTFDQIKGVKADKDKNRLLLIDGSGNTLLVIAKQ
ncbi:META domain-containing protein [Parabacteroides sp. PF5-6]|uniref:META domain-containing protein n=1 Tax=Parabacteroides sp. PF5-6 TaxID=1742403 RepID=UPI002405DE59|nr:META domain-containing protein [Parabacteroides sp. PF5-6]MDF9829364.1 heat shock protein HslJ [Parabacteroides sp. PF5-6]